MFLDFCLSLLPSLIYSTVKISPLLCASYRITFPPLLSSRLFFASVPVYLCIFDFTLLFPANRTRLPVICFSSSDLPALPMLPTPLPQAPSVLVISTSSPLHLYLSYVLFLRRWPSISLSAGSFSCPFPSLECPEKRGMAMLRNHSRLLTFISKSCSDSFTATTDTTHFIIFR